MLHVLTHFFTKLDYILHTGAGWLVALGLIIADYFAGHAFVIGLVVATTLMDAIWGIAVSISQKKFALSELARLTIGKLAVYGCAMFVFVGLDRFIESTITASIVGAAIVLVEFWSSSASMLILFPDFLWLRLIRKALIGEMARKLNITEEQVKEEMDKHDKERIEREKERMARHKKHQDQPKNEDEQPTQDK